MPVKLKRLELDRFTAFEKTSFDFESGVNVLIGENGTGKSHVLKLIYSLHESIRRHETGEGTGAAVRASSVDEVLAELLSSVFQPTSSAGSCAAARAAGRPRSEPPGRRRSESDISSSR